MLKPDEELSEFIRSSDCINLARNTENFRCPGFYNNELGDFIMKVVSSILRIPIVTGHFPFRKKFQKVQC